MAKLAAALLLAVVATPPPAVVLGDRPLAAPQRDTEWLSWVLVDCTSRPRSDRERDALQALDHCDFWDWDNGLRDNDLDALRAQGVGISVHSECEYQEYGRAVAGANASAGPVLDPTHFGTRQFTDNGIGRKESGATAIIHRCPHHENCFFMAYMDHASEKWHLYRSVKHRTAARTPFIYI